MRREKAWEQPNTLRTPFGDYAVPSDLPKTRWVDGIPDARFKVSRQLEVYLQRVNHWAADEYARDVKSDAAPPFAALMTEH